MISYVQLIAWMGVILFVTGTTVACALMLALQIRSFRDRVASNERSDRRH